MWFARFFGGRKARTDDEPARFAPTPSARPIQSAGRAQGNVSNAAAKSTEPPGAAARKPHDKSRGGFDPYNSGSFDRSHAWERVIRR